MFTNYLYIKIFKDAFEIRLLGKDQASSRHTPSHPFTTSRLLVGTFSAAEACLKPVIKETLGKSSLFSSAKIVMHPMEMCEGGLSEVEERIFMELAFGSGARQVKVHVGAELDDTQVLEMLKKA
ncbi:hypothetical protein ACFOEK_08580 [Litoribrevibacter euphylliae]|uniref:Rod shape-determining protein MreB n=1 Tax=Litoribrevibacter euphylliae TaxID=1834034 RepID=A0ABV7HED3_9GAMM